MGKRTVVGWMELLLGIVYSIMGIYTLLNPGPALGGFLAVYGIVAIVSGFVDIVLFSALERWKGVGPLTLVISGTLNILLGIYMVMDIGTGLIGLTVIFPIWFIMHCLARLSNIGYIRGVFRRQYIKSLVVNALGIILACMLIFSSFVAMQWMTVIAGIYFLLLGMGNITNSFGKVSKIHNSTE